MDELEINYNLLMVDIDQTIQTMNDLIQNIKSVTEV